MTEDKNALAHIFSIPVQRRATATRINRTVARVKADGFNIERCGRQWEVWSDKPEHAGVTAIYDRLSDIPSSPLGHKPTQSLEDQLTAADEAGTLDWKQMILPPKITRFSAPQQVSSNSFDAVFTSYGEIEFANGITAQIKNPDFDWATYVISMPCR